MSDDAVIPRAVWLLLSELLDGADGKSGWVLNKTDPGLLDSLERIPAARASAPAPDGGGSVAAHVEHLRYGFGLLNRWIAGDDPFATADYRRSWTRGTVGEAEWNERREAFTAEARAWMEAIAGKRDLDLEGATAIIASAVHLAYHLGAIRQIDPRTRGPRATD